ncbi:MAG: N-6 DNA methylase [Bacteroidia bacterium]|nr:N-6 DNA methylase [Bacteroidia bacterium]
MYGWDIDPEAIRRCVQNLNQLVQPLGVEVRWNIRQVQWNIYQADAIKKIESTLSAKARHPAFDFIVGNPPYIRIQHLDEQQRRYIQKYYRFCKSGSTDMYIAFFELCLALLSHRGVCGLITPNTYFYTATAKALRDHFVPRKHQTLIKKITNYGQIQLFDKATTYSAITIFSKKRTKSFCLRASPRQTSILLPPG